MHEDQTYGGLGWAGPRHPSISERDSAEVELIRQLYPLVCALAGEGDRLNLTLLWLVSTVKSELTSSELS